MFELSALWEEQWFVGDPQGLSSLEGAEKFDLLLSVVGLPAVQPLSLPTSLVFALAACAVLPAMLLHPGLVFVGQPLLFEGEGLLGF